jgi:hypothetical protein
MHGLTGKDAPSQFAAKSSRHLDPADTGTIAHTGCEQSIDP